MLVELLLLVLIAAAVFAFVLAPLVLPERARDDAEQSEPEVTTESDSVAAERQIVHEPS